MSKILIGSNFSGRYNHKYIGHEFINLFPSDSREWYFYIPSYGCVIKKFGKGNEPDFLVMIQTIKGRNYLIGIATGLEYVSNCYRSTDKEEIEKENKLHGSISYFGKNLNDWFTAQPNTLYISYKLKEQGHIYFPSDNISMVDSDTSNNERNSNKDIFVQLDVSNNPAHHNPDNIISIPKSWSCYKKDRTKLIGQSQRSYYIDPSTKFEDKIKDLINDGLLCDVTKSSTISPSKIKTMFDFNILNLIGEENIERVFSHWLGEYLADVEFYKCFAAKVGLKAHVSSVDVTTELADRNQKRVDIAIETSDELILIENKIHLNVHETTITGKRISQLDAYLDGAKEYLKNKNVTKTIKPFLLCPNYYETYGFAGNPKLWDKSIWKPIYYSQIKDIVNEFMKIKGYLPCQLEYFYLDEFSKALSVHAKKRPETLREHVLRQIAKKL